ncbi:MAG: SGNH/GDSL hydrolase family protein [Planctomycetaceae bacterium]|nr:SGNH/GDSL hydrolase family protein [Planctomycetaceae bacterium]
MTLKTLPGILSTCLAAVLFVSVAHADDPAALAGKRVVVVGDSITQAGGYVSFASYYLEKQNPDKQFDIISVGLSSETVSGLSEPNHAGGRFPRPCLFERFGRVLEKTKPEVIFMCYGMNDGIYLPLDDERFAAFQNGVNQFIDQSKAAGVKEIYIITPPIFDFPPGEAGFNYDTVLTAYAQWETTIKQPGVHVIDLHTPMSKAREARTEVFSKDRIHPGDEGHLFMARTILQSLGMNIPEESVATVKADTLYKQVDTLRRHRSSGWMNHIGYTREKTVEPQPLGDTETKAAELRKAIDELKSSL